MKATATANSNIAIIKYWGNRDERLFLPMNNSISFTMDEQLSTITTVEFDSGLKKDELTLDGRTAGRKQHARVAGFLDAVRQRAGIKTSAKVVSENSFPMAAGLASSASGFAALAAAAGRAAGLDYSQKDISILARFGSGSATRSVYGGAAEWLGGSRPDGSDSYAVQLSDKRNWRHLRNIVALASAKEKKIGSREAMALTVRTSRLFRQRITDVGRRLETVRNAIINNDFESMIDTIMQESDSMHACMADTVPPVVYLSETSHKIIRAVRALNENKKIAAYTFDAGPNAHIYTTQGHSADVKGMLGEIEGVHRIIECRIGEGVRFGKRHLF